MAAKSQAANKVKPPARVSVAGKTQAGPSVAGHETVTGVAQVQRAAGGMGRRRVLVHSSGFRMSPYADIRPAGEDTRSAARAAPRKL